MSDPREALLGRFRATLQARVRSVGELFDALFRDLEDAAAKKHVLGELHTLKGEARMLGLGALARLAHALEEHTGGAPSPTIVLRALEAMRVALAPDTAPAEASRVLEEALRDVAIASALEGAQPAPAPTPDGDADADAVTETQTSDAPAPNDAADATRRGERWIQVRADVVDELCERIVELSAAFGALTARTREVLNNKRVDGRVAAVTLLEDFARCQALIDGSTTRAWSLRLVPVEPILRELGQHARAMAAGHRKAIAVRIHAAGVQLERDVLDQLWDSLLHLVQNAVDHGLEPPDERGHKDPRGVLSLRAEARGGSVAIFVEDDGRGIDVELVRRRAVERGVLSRSEAADMSAEDVLELVFHHGFSTRDTVSATSGRGIGLDVVKRRIESLGGAVAIDTVPGAGTRFSLSVPYTVTRERALILQIADALYGLPSRVVRAVLGEDAPGGGANEQPDVLRFEGEALPLASLAAALGLHDDTPETRALVLELSGRRYGVRVARIVGEHELIRRPAEPLLARASPIGASALIDDGRMVLFPELAALTHALRRTPTARAHAPARPAPQRRQRVLVVDDSSVVRDLIREILVSAGLAVETATDGAAALEAIQRSEPDLVMTDLEMPRMNGFELLAEVRKRSQRLPVIMLTTRGSTEDRQRATALGANAYVLKVGFRTETLLDVVSRFVQVS